MNLNILTVTLGRDLYLKRLIKSINELSGWKDYNFKHYIVYQGIVNEDIDSFIKNIEYSKHIVLIKNETSIKVSIGEALNQFKAVCGEGLFWKLDDDAQLVSNNSFKHIEELYKLVGNAVFSPYPVGLINNPGGVPSKSHTVFYSTTTDTYYTLRKVHHVGGFARIMPVECFKQITFTNTHSEDTECSSWCNSKSIPMYYLENALIVEHQESTLGQHARYGNDYFKGRF